MAVFLSRKQKAWLICKKGYLKDIMLEINRVFGINIGNFPVQDIHIENMTGIQWGNGTGKDVLIRQIIVSLSSRLNYSFSETSLSGLSKNNPETVFLSKHKLNENEDYETTLEGRYKNLTDSLNLLFNHNYHRSRHSFSGIYFINKKTDEYFVSITFPEMAETTKLDRVYFKLKNKDSYTKIFGYLKKSIPKELKNRDTFNAIKDLESSEVSNEIIDTIRESHKTKRSDKCAYLNKNSFIYLGYENQFSLGDFLVTAFSPGSTKGIENSIKFKAIEEVIEQVRILKDNSINDFKENQESAISILSNIIKMKEINIPEIKKNKNIIETQIDLEKLEYDFDEIKEENYILVNQINYIKEQYVAQKNKLNSEISNIVNKIIKNQKDKEELTKYEENATVNGKHISESLRANKDAKVLLEEYKKEYEKEDLVSFILELKNQNSIIESNSAILDEENKIRTEIHSIEKRLKRIAQENEDIGSKIISEEQRLNNLKNGKKSLFDDEVTPIEQKYYLKKNGFTNVLKEDCSPEVLESLNNIINYIKSEDNPLFPFPSNQELLSLQEEIKSNNELGISRIEDSIANKKKELESNKNDIESDSVLLESKKIKMEEINRIRSENPKETILKNKSIIRKIEAQNNRFYNLNAEVICKFLNDEQKKELKEIQDKSNYGQEKLIEFCENILSNNRSMYIENRSKIKEIDEYDVKLTDEKLKATNILEKLENDYHIDETGLSNLDIFINKHDKDYKNYVPVNDDDVIKRSKENLTGFKNSVISKYEKVRIEYEGYKQTYYNISQNDEIKVNPEFTRFLTNSDPTIDELKEIFDALLTLFDVKINEFELTDQNSIDIENNINNINNFNKKIHRDIRRFIQKRIDKIKTIKSNSGHYFDVKKDNYIKYNELDNQFRIALINIFKYDVWREEEGRIDSEFDFIKCLDKASIDDVRQLKSYLENIVISDDNIEDQIRNRLLEKTNDFNLCTFSGNREETPSSSGNAIVILAKLKDTLLSDNKYFKSLFFINEIGKVDDDNLIIISENIKDIKSSIVFLGNDGFEFLRNKLSVMNTNYRLDEYFDTEFSRNKPDRKYHMNEAVWLGCQ